MWTQIKFIHVRQFLNQETNTHQLSTQLYIHLHVDSQNIQITDIGYDHGSQKIF
jgi:hypothetical protein